MGLEAPAESGAVCFGHPGRLGTMAARSPRNCRKAVCLLPLLPWTRQVFAAVYARAARGSPKRIAALRTRTDQLYEHKLDGKITEEFWARKQAEYSEQERSMETALSSMNRPVSSEPVLTVARIFETVQRAHSLYLTRNYAERGQLLITLLLNCATDGVNLWRTYRKPFDLIFHRAKNEEWSALADDFRTFLVTTDRLPGVPQF